MMCRAELQRLLALRRLCRCRRRRTRRACRCRRLSTGTRRRNSSASETRAEPGRVDSAPMSMMSAPSSSSSMARAKARSGSILAAVGKRVGSDVEDARRSSVRSPSMRVVSRIFHSKRLRGMSLQRSSRAGPVRSILRVHGRNDSVDRSGRGDDRSDAPAARAGVCHLPQRTKKWPKRSDRW